MSSEFCPGSCDATQVTATSLRDRAQSEAGPRGPCYSFVVKVTLEARVRNGRLVLDEPVDLPEGTTVQLVPVDDDDLDDADRARLHAALLESAEQFERGEGIPAADVLERLRRT